MDEIKPVKRIALIGCCGQKLAHAAPARELYLSDLFRKSLAYAERTCDAIHVLSAKLHLVDIDQVIEPYDQTLLAMLETDREAWAHRCWTQLRDYYAFCSEGQAPLEYRFVFLAGKVYIENLAAEIEHNERTGSFLGENRNQLRIDTPLAGMGIGKRKSWLLQQVELNQLRAA